MTLPEALRDRAKTYELNALAEQEQSNDASAVFFLAVSQSLREFANVAEELGVEA